MLKEAGGINKVIIVCGKTDLRRGADGLASVIRYNYGLEPLEEGTLFLFCGIRRDRMKAILWEGDGMLLLTKKLNHGSHFCWPRDSREARDISIEQYRRLLDGFTIDSSIHKFPIKADETP